MPQIKNSYGVMRTENQELRTKYENLIKDYNKLIDENRTLYEIKNDTIQAIEIFKKLQSESTAREKVYEAQIAKLTVDKRNLHRDRTRLTKQLLEKHRDMIILNSEIGKFSHDHEDSRWVPVARRFRDQKFNFKIKFQVKFIASDVLPTGLLSIRI